MDVQPDGRIIAVGDYYFNSPYNQFYIQRLMPDGTPDTTLGGEDNLYPGAVFFNYGAKSAAQDVAVLPDGKILVCGYTSDQTGNSGNKDLLVVKFNSDGTVDTTFGQQGVFTTNISDSQTAESITLQGDKILVSGTLGPGSLMRLNANGTIDTTFGTSGYAPYGGNKVIVMPDGNLLVPFFGPLNAGFAARGVRKYNSEGILDSTFGNGGTASVDFTGVENYINDLFLAPDGKIFFTGTHRISSSMPYYGVIVGFDAQGNILNDFGNGGKVIRIPSIGMCHGKGIMIQNNKLVVAYTTGITSNYDYTVAAYNMDGTPFTEFADNGELTFYFGSLNQHDYLETTHVQPDGKLLLAGRAADGATIARLGSVNSAPAGAESFSKNNIKIYPNPATDIVTISVGNQSEKSTVTIYSTVGSVICTETFSSNVHTINIGGFQRGIYFVKIESDGKTYQQKLIVR